MERSRSNRITANSLSPSAAPGVARLDGDFQGAKVMMLGRLRPAHVPPSEAAVAPTPPERMRPKRRSAGRDLRGAAPAPRQNHLLGALNEEDYARLIRHLEFVPLPCGKVLGEAGSIPEYVYFPTAGIVSMLYEMKNGTSVEAAVTGHDGVVGVTVFMGGGATTNRAVVRNSGHGYRMRADILKREFEESPTLRQPLLRYTQALLDPDGAERDLPRPPSAGRAVLPAAALQHGPAALERRRADAGHDRQSARRAPRKHHRGGGEAAGGRVDPISARPDHGSGPPGAGIASVRVLRDRQGGARSARSAARADAGRCARRCGVRRPSPTTRWSPPRTLPPSVFARHAHARRTPRDGSI